MRTLPDDIQDVPVYWTEAERWAWEQVRQGEVADFNARCGKLDPHKGNDPGWQNEDRQLSQRFIEDVLTCKPWKDALHRLGLMIFGARLPEGLDLIAADVKANVRLIQCSLMGDVLLYDARFSLNLSFEGSVLAESFRADNLSVDGSLFLRSGTKVHGDLRLLGANVGGYLDMSGSSFLALNAEGLTVDGCLFLRGGATVEDELRLAGAKIGGDLDMSDSTFQAVNAEGVSVTGSVLMRGSEFAQPPNFKIATIANSFTLAGTTLHGLELAAATIGQELILAHDTGNRPNWQREAYLHLANAQVGALNDGPDGVRRDAWPDYLFLSGFKYSQLGGVETAHIQNRPARWFLQWISRDVDGGPQPYHQLANVLREAGRLDVADRIIFAWKKKELDRRFEALNVRQEKPAQALLSALAMQLHKSTVGFGIGSYFLYRALGSALGLIFLGFLVLHGSSLAREHGHVWMLLASFDKLLPGISLNEGFNEFFKWPAEAGKSDLTYWQFVYFCCHNLLGIVLLSFVVAALPNFTRKSHKDS